MIAANIPRAATARGKMIASSMNAAPRKTMAAYATGATRAPT